MFNKPVYIENLIDEMSACISEQRLCDWFCWVSLGVRVRII